MQPAAGVAGGLMVHGSAAAGAVGAGGSQQGSPAGEPVPALSPCQRAAGNRVLPLHVRSQRGLVTRRSA